MTQEERTAGLFLEEQNKQGTVFRIRSRVGQASGGIGMKIADNVPEEHACFIVTACNAHDELVASERDNLAALENLLAYLRKHEGALPPVSTASLEVRIEKTRAALAKLEGK